MEGQGKEKGIPSVKGRRKGARGGARAEESGLDPDSAGAEEQQPREPARTSSQIVQQAEDAARAVVLTATAAGR